MQNFIFNEFYRVKVKLSFEPRARASWRIIEWFHPTSFSKSNKASNYHSKTSEIKRPLIRLFPLVKSAARSHLRHPDKNIHIRGGRFILYIFIIHFHTLAGSPMHIQIEVKNSGRDAGKVSKAAVHLGVGAHDAALALICVCWKHLKGRNHGSLAQYATNTSATHVSTH